MRSTRTGTALALVSAALVLVLASPAGAASTSQLRRQRDAARARRAQLAAQLDAARASDQQLLAAMNALDAQVGSQIATTRAAQQAAAAAETSLHNAEGRLAATQRRVSQLRVMAQTDVIQAYMHAGGHSALDILKSKDLSELSRREEILSQVVSNARDVLDTLRAAEQDQAAERARLAKVRDLTRSRRRQAADKLRALAANLRDQARLRGALDGRIADYTAEADAVAAQEGNLVQIIKVAESANTGPASASGLIWPCRGPLTSGFGMRWGRLHQGQDIACGYGTPIHAAKDGTVIFAGQMSGYGNVVIIDHGGGFSTLYAHQSRLGVSQGQHVNQGDVIGYVGSTGHSTGPHLHFETRFNGVARNPLPYLP